MDRYKIFIRDPNYKNTIFHFEFDGSSWLTVPQSSDSDQGALGERFFDDPINRVLTIDSE